MIRVVLDGINDLLPVLRDRAQEAEDRRVLSDETIKSLEEIGFFRLLQPARFGGYEADPTLWGVCTGEAEHVMRECANACLQRMYARSNEDPGVD